MKRREVLTAMLATAALGGNVTEIRAQARAERQLKPLPFAAGSLDGISERVITRITTTTTRARSDGWPRSKANSPDCPMTPLRF
jgi:hypothetical protein